MAALFAASYPARTSALVLFGSFARRLYADDYPWGAPAEIGDLLVEQFEQGWGRPLGLRIGAPSSADDQGIRKWWAGMLRASGSPASAAAMLRMSLDTDIRNVLGSIHVPTLVLHEVGDIPAPIEGGRYVAEHIPGAGSSSSRRQPSLLLRRPGRAHRRGPAVPHRDALAPKRNRVLATVVFTDVVRSTEHAVELGDESWADLLEQHHATVARGSSSADGRSTRRATGSSPASTAPHAPFAAPVRSATRCETLGSRSGPGSTPANAT